MPITSVLFRRCSPKDVANYVALDIFNGNTVVNIVSCVDGGFIFCYG